MNLREIISVRGAKEYLKCSSKTIYRLAQSGHIECFKMGNRLKIYKDSLVHENINAVRPKFLK